MKVRDFIKDIGKSLSLNPSDVFKVKKKYVSLYRANMVLLYDEGFISDPTCFNEKEIRRNVIDCRISELVQNSGRIVLDSNQVDFALGIEKNLSEEGEKFLRILQKVLYYRELCKGIDKFYDTNFTQTNTSSKCTVNLGVKMSGTKIVTRKPYDISSAILECCFNEKMEGKKVVCRTLYRYIFDEALKELGLEGNTEDGLFVKGMSRESEIAHCDLILDGLVSLNGSKAKLLEDWLRCHAWDPMINIGYKFIKVGLFTYIKYQKMEEMKSWQELLLNEIIDEKGIDNVLFMTTDRVYYLEDEEEVDFPISLFVIFCDSKDTISSDDRNVLEGYTGEVYPLDFFTEDHSKGFYVGCPFELYYPDSDRTTLVVDLEQTSFYDPNKTNVSWFSYEDGASITFSKSVYYKGEYSKGSIEDAIFRVYGDAEEGKILGKLPRQIVLDPDFSKAKDRVLRLSVIGGKFKLRRDGLDLLLEGNLIDAKENLHLSGLKDKQIDVLIQACNEGLEYDDLWKIANPAYTVKSMKDLSKRFLEEKEEKENSDSKGD